MENNEENLGSQEPVTNSNSVKTTNGKLIGIIVAILVVILAVIFIFFTRSPKSAVKDYLKAWGNYNAKKAMSVVDYEGTAAFAKIVSTKYEGGKLTYSYDFDKFEDNYDDIMDAIKDLDKDGKKDYKELKENAIDTFQDACDELKEEKIKISVKDIKTEKVEDCKKLTKVTCTVEAKHDDDKEETEMTFFTMKKGLKNYIVYIPTDNL